MASTFVPAVSLGTDGDAVEVFRQATEAVDRAISGLVLGGAPSPKVNEEPLVLRPTDAIERMAIEDIEIACPEIEHGPGPIRTTVRAMMPPERIHQLCDLGRDRLRQRIPVEVRAKGKARSALLDRVEAHPVSPMAYEATISFSWAAHPPVPKPMSSAPEKPRELAAGQVWEVPDLGAKCIRRTLVSSGIGGDWWSYEENPNNAVHRPTLLRVGRYLGTKEEVAAREGKAAASAPVAPWEMPRPGSRSWFVQEIARACDAAEHDVTIHDPPPGEDGTIEIEVRGCLLAAGQVWELTWAPGDVQRFVLTWPHYAINGAWHFEGGEGGIYITSETILGGRYPVRYLGTKEEVAAREAKPTDIRVDPATGAPGLIRGADAIQEAVLNRMRKWPMPKPDPYSYASFHRAIDAAIAADSGPFAHARAAALRAWGERGAFHGDMRTPREAIVYLQTYEAERGAQRFPSVKAAAMAADKYGLGCETIAVYERERSRSPVHGRRG